MNGGASMSARKRFVLDFFSQAALMPMNRAASASESVVVGRWAHRFGWSTLLLSASRAPRVGMLRTRMRGAPWLRRFPFPDAALRRHPECVGSGDFVCQLLF